MLQCSLTIANRESYYIILYYLQYKLHYTKLAAARAQFLEVL